MKTPSDEPVVGGHRFPPPQEAKKKHGKTTEKMERRSRKTIEASGKAHKRTFPSLAKRGAKKLGKGLAAAAGFLGIGKTSRAQRARGRVAKVGRNIGLGTSTTAEKRRRQIGKPLKAVGKGAKVVGKGVWKVTKAFGKGVGKAAKAVGKGTAKAFTALPKAVKSAKENREYVKQVKAEAADHRDQEFERTQVRLTMQREFQFANRELIDLEDAEGRISAQTITNEKGETIISSGDEINDEAIAVMRFANLERVEVQEASLFPSPVTADDVEKTGKLKGVMNEVVGFYKPDGARIQTVRGAIAKLEESLQTRSKYLLPGEQEIVRNAIHVFKEIEREYLAISQYFLPETDQPEEQLNQYMKALESPAYDRLRGHMANWALAYGRLQDICSEGKLSPTKKQIKKMGGVQGLGVGDYVIQPIQWGPRDGLFFKEIESCVTEAGKQKVLPITNSFRAFTNNLNLEQVFEGIKSGANKDDIAFMRKDLGLTSADQLIRLMKQVGTTKVDKFKEVLVQFGIIQEREDFPGKYTTPTPGFEALSAAIEQAQLVAALQHADEDLGDEA